jgi:dihydroneopterin aldolase
MDCIHLTNILCYGYTGALPEEQVLGQRFEVDVTLWLDLSQAGESDRLKDTVDYGTLAKKVQEIVKTSKFALLERLAMAIAQAILTPKTCNTIAVQQVRVRVSKLAAPIPDFTGRVTVELTREIADIPDPHFQSDQ